MQANGFAVCGNTLGLHGRGEWLKYSGQDLGWCQVLYAYCDWVECGKAIKRPCGGRGFRG